MRAWPEGAVSYQPKSPHAPPRAGGRGRPYEGSTALLGQSMGRDRGEESFRVQRGHQVESDPIRGWQGRGNVRCALRSDIRFNTSYVIPKDIIGRSFVQRRAPGDGGSPHCSRVDRATRGGDARCTRPVGSTVLARPKAQLSGRAHVMLCWSPTMKRRDRRDLPHSTYQCLQRTRRPGFVRRGLRAVSGGVRSAGAGRFRLGDVPVPCRRSRSRPRLLGGSFWAFSVNFGRAQHHLRGRGVFWGGTGGLGRVVENK